MPALLELSGVELVRGGKTILDHIDLAVDEREIVTLIGPNGAGKSSLVKIALGLEQPDGGRVSRRPDLRIGYLPQRLTLDAALPLSVRRVMTLTLRASDAEIRAALALTGAESLIDESVHTLSGGELQRVMLARALLRRPNLLVLDEPTQNLDITGAVECYETIQRVRDTSGCGVLLVSHDLSIVMAATTRVYCLNGHVCCSGNPDDVSRDPEFLRMFGPRGAGTLALYTHHHDHEHKPGAHRPDHGQGHAHGHDHTRHDGQAHRPEVPH